MLQEQMFYLFLALTAVTVVIFIFVARSTRQTQTPEYAAVHRIRKRLFLTLAGCLVLFLALTLPLMPYASERQRPDRVVYVSAKQFAFLISASPLTPDEASGEEPVEQPAVNAGELIEFRVTSLDVTHGFGIYDAKGHLLAQTQAMPGYVNRLRFRFDQAGTYPILCMEFCGMAHHAMRGTLKVTAANPNKTTP
jgi:cytochrome c oxidase subunit 2